MQNVLETDNDNISKLNSLELRSKLEQAINQEIVDAKQKAKCDWLLLGDEASAFFYTKMSTRRYSHHWNNHIKLDGSLCQDVELANKTVLCYTKLFNQRKGFYLPL